MTIKHLGKQNYSTGPKLPPLKEPKNAGPKAQPAKSLDNIPNRRQSLNEWLDKILWPQSKQMQNLVQ
jgi:hypothetical protein